MIVIQVFFITIMEIFFRKSAKKYSLIVFVDHQCMDLCWLYLHKLSVVKWGKIGAIASKIQLCDN